LSPNNDIPQFHHTKPAQLLYNPLPRISFLSGLGVLLFLGLIFQLYNKQVINYGYYSALAKKQQTSQITDQAQRGRIYVHDKMAGNYGVETIDTEKEFHPVAINVERYDVMVVPKNVSDKENCAKKLSELLGIDYKILLEGINNDKLYIPPIAKKVDKELAQKISDLNITGVLTMPVWVRNYPEGESAAQIIGFTNSDNIGAYGIERYYNSELTGVPGVISGTTDTTGKMISIEDQSTPQDGIDLVLTIDSSAQYIVEQELKEAIEKYGATGGSIIVAEPDSGRIIAMASSPSYDPNTYNEVPETEQWKFVNPSVTNVWEPGSIFKPIIVAAALDAGLIEPETKPEIPFQNYVTVDGYDIHNSQDKSYGYETMTQVLENSDNVGMIWIANKLGNETMGQYLENFGFGSKTGIDVEAESSGQLADSETWRNVNRATISFGQGISTTAIQMVAAYCAIANGGTLVKPHLLDMIISSTGETKEIESTEIRQVLKAETVPKIRDMLVSVVVNGHGKKAAVSGFKVAGKTGTAQIAKTDGSGYEEDAHIGSFIGFAPADDPKFVMLVKLDRPSAVEWAESSAAPTFGEIAKWLLTQYYNLPGDV